MEQDVLRLEISKDTDKETVAAILVMNGYTVRKAKVVLNGKSRYVIEAWKDEK